MLEIRFSECRKPMARRSHLQLHVANIKYARNEMVFISAIADSLWPRSLVISMNIIITHLSNGMTSLRSLKIFIERAAFAPAFLRRARVMYNTIMVIFTILTTFGNLNLSHSVRRFYDRDFLSAARINLG